MRDPMGLDGLKAGDSVTILFDDGEIMDVATVRRVQGDDVLIDGPSWSDWFNVRTRCSVDTKPGQPAPTFRRTLPRDAATLARKGELSALRDEMRRALWYEMDLETLQKVKKVVAGAKLAAHGAASAGRIRKQRALR